MCVCVCVCVCVHKIKSLALYQKHNCKSIKLQLKKKQNIHFGVKWMGILTPAPSLIIWEALESY